LQLVVAMLADFIPIEGAVDPTMSISEFSGIEVAILADVASISEFSGIRQCPSLSFSFSVL
jgi:hypothetical protein